MSTVTVGRVNHLGFRDERTGETWATLVPETPAKVAGPGWIRIQCYSVYPLFPGEVLAVHGEWTRAGRLGDFLAVKKIERRPPSTPEGEIKALAGMIEGLSEASARALIEKEGSIDGVRDLATNRPQELEELLPGANRRKARYNLRTANWDRDYDPDLVGALRGAGVSNNHIQKMVRYYGAEPLKVVAQTRPYDLVEVEGIGFATADRIAEHYADQQGRPFDFFHPQRLLFGMCQVVGAARGNGDVCVEPEQAVKRAFRELKSPSKRPMPRVADADKKLQEALAKAVTDSLLKESFGMIYTRGMEKAERSLALHLAKMVKQGVPPSKSDIRTVDKMLAEHAKRDGWSLTDEQTAAVHMAIGEPVSVFTGGPGTGKTTTSAKIVAGIEKLHRTYLLVAPTGKAAKRAADVTGSDASTIHRACGLDGEDDVHSKRYGRNLNRLDYFRVDYVLVDESSMLDLALAFELIRRIRPGRTKLILIGDCDQLPPVGAGQVFRDLIQAHAGVMVAELERDLKDWERASGPGAFPALTQALDATRQWLGHPEVTRLLASLAEARGAFKDIAETEGLRISESRGGIAVTRLTVPKRQAGGSPIVDCAYEINAGQLPSKFEPGYEVRLLDPHSSPEWQPTGDPETDAAMEEHITFRWLRGTIDRYAEVKKYHPIKDIQVYCPQNTGPAGIARLNVMLRDHLNPLPANMPTGRYDVVKISGGFVAQPGDKVMQTQNHYSMRLAGYEDVPDPKKAPQKGKKRRRKARPKEGERTEGIVPVMNGMIGYITRVDTGENRRVYVKFDDLDDEVVYRDSMEWGKLSPSYAMTIHKSQGSEIPCGIIVGHSAMRMINRPLIYTAWTRAKKSVVCIMPAQTLAEGVKSLRGVQRNSNLAKRLLELLYERRR